MELGLFEFLPPEILRIVCRNLDFDDVLSLQEAHPQLNLFINSSFFRDFRTMHVVWNAKGANLYLSGPSCSKTFEMNTNSYYWEDVFDRTKFIRNLKITKTADAKDFSVLEAIEKRGWIIQNLEICLKPGERDVSWKTICSSYKKLTSFASSLRRDLEQFRLESDGNNSVEFRTEDDRTTFRFEHEYNQTFSNQFLTPLIQSLVVGRDGMEKVTLAVNCGKNAALALQSAFQASLPFEHRTKLTELRIDFGTSVSHMSTGEIHKLLTEHAPYLNGTRNLNYLICDLSHSLLEADALEQIYTTMSRELTNNKHRISLITAPPTKLFSSGLQRIQNRVAVI